MIRLLPADQRNFYSATSVLLGNPKFYEKNLPGGYGVFLFLPI
jgi:hypothetical protein